MSAIPITVTGTIATEPTARTLPSGRACSSFRLAVNHWRVDRATGEFSNDGTSWFGVDCYGDLARNATMSLGKGAAVIVTGTLRNREWATEERSGIAPTVIAEHIGPDLRFGTANYQRAKGAERSDNDAAKAAGSSETSESGGWADLPTPPSGAGSAPDEDGIGPVVASGGSDDETRDGDDDAPGSDNLRDAEHDAAAGNDDAIAAETAKAAAPF